jgi:hypothetical protein
MASLRQLHVSEVVGLPKGVKALKNKLVLNRKQMQEGVIEWYKTRLGVSVLHKSQVRRPWRCLYTCSKNC